MNRWSHRPRRSARQLARAVGNGRSVGEALRHLVVDSSFDPPWEKCARRAVPHVTGDLLNLSGEGGRTPLARAQHMAAQRRAEQVAGHVDAPGLLAELGLDARAVSAERWRHGAVFAHSALCTRLAA